MRAARKIGPGFRASERNPMSTASGAGATGRLRCFRRHDADALGFKFNRVTQQVVSLELTYHGIRIGRRSVVDNVDGGCRDDRVRLTR